MIKRLLSFIWRLLHGKFLVQPDAISVPVSVGDSSPSDIGDNVPVKRKKVPNQVLLRIIDENGNLHVIHRGAPGTLNNGWPYIMEGHFGQPESWRKATPGYFMPITQEELAEEYRKQGREWIMEDEEW